MSLSKCQHRGCKAVPEADLRKAFSALLMCAERGAVCSKQRDAGCELQESQFCSVHGVVQELLGPQEGPAGGLAHLPGRAQGATCHKHWDAACERAVREDVENGFCTSDASVKEPPGPQGTSATGKALHGILRRLPGKRFWSHPTLILVLILLLFLVLILVLALAVLSARQVPVAATPPPSVLGCPCGWLGHCGMCYYFSKDQGTWEQGQQRCSELGASLAVVKDEEMDLLFYLSGNVGYWLGLRRRGERLQWRDGSDFTSSVRVLGNSECVYLADKKFRSESCSNRQPYLCSKAQAPL